MDKNIEKLLEIGFNKLEAEVYLYLLSHPPATAYKIGKDINKPTANVYKAIESLAGKGSVIVEDNKTRLCRAVAPDEFLNMYERSVVEKTRSVKELLNSIHKKSDDEKTYSINSVELVLERFRSMMERCKSIAVIDAFPLALNNVLDSVQKAVKRGVKVHVEAYKPVAIKGAKVVYPAMSGKVLQHWHSQQLNLVIDGEEHLIALMDEDLKKVRQAVWSNNTYMSCLLLGGILREQAIVEIITASEKPGFEKKVRDILKNQMFFYNSNIPGFNKIFKNENDRKQKK